MGTSQCGSGPVGVPGWGERQQQRLVLQNVLFSPFYSFCWGFGLCDLENLTLVCEHSLHRGGKERRLQQLGPGYLVAGSISRLLRDGDALGSNVVDRSAIIGQVSCIDATAFETAIVGP